LSLPDEHERARRPDPAALILGVALLGIAALIAWNASSLGGGGAYERVGPKNFPYVIAAGLGLLSLWTLAEAWRGAASARSGCG
jgi:putative tricarboxylic transport membrane protein